MNSVTTTGLVQPADTSSDSAALMKKKRSLPSLRVPSRQTSIRNLDSHPSPPHTAALDRTFTTTSSPSSPTKTATLQPPPPVPARKESDIRSRLVEARRKRDEQYSGVVTVGRNGSRPASPVVSSYMESSPRPSFSQPHRLRTQTSIEQFSAKSQDTVTARPSLEASNRHGPSTAASAKLNPIIPTQGELEGFDFKFQPRPHTAIASPTRSPKPDLAPDFPGIKRPRQVSDAESSWQRSPKFGDHEFTPPWAAVYQREQRGSAASGFSSGSSTLDTQRSSVFTKASAISERTEDNEEIDDYADDILDMYYGVKDDNLHSITETNDDDILKDGEDRLDGDNTNDDDNENARVKRKSMMIAQIMESSIDEEMSRQSSQQTGSTLATEESASADSLEVRLDKQTEHKPPRFAVKSTTHDQYGFKKSNREISLEAYDNWWKEYSDVQKHRTSRWKEYLKSEGLSSEDPRCFPTPSSKTRRFIQKGIPPTWRGNAWFFYAGGHEYLDRHPGRYQELLSQAQEGKLSKLDRDSIERDLHRTFPDNIHFKPDQTAPNTTPNPNDPLFDREETPILSALRRLLSAFAIDHPRIGYCQSLNFLAGMLLLFLPEERAFWLLHIITTEFLPGTHEMSLEGTNVDLYVLMLAIREHLPSVWLKLGAMPSENNPAGPNEMWDGVSVRLPPVTLCTTSWFMSLFIGTLPIETTLRVWDVLFYDGAKTLFRTSLAILKAGENEIKAIQDPMEIFQVIQTLPRRMIGSGELLARATQGGRGSVSGTWLEKHRSIRRAFFAKERGVEVARKQSKVSRKGSRKASKDEAAGDKPETAPGLGEVPRVERVPTRKASAWFAKRKDTIRKPTVPVA